MTLLEMAIADRGFRIFAIFVIAVHLYSWYFSLSDIQLSGCVRMVCKLSIMID
jgi:hypothetical protein